MARDSLWTDARPLFAALAQLRTTAGRFLALSARLFRHPENVDAAIDSVGVHPDAFVIRFLSLCLSLSLNTHSQTVSRIVRICEAQ